VNYFERPIGGTIVHDHQLNPVVKLLVYALQGRGDELFAVVGRHDDGKQWSQND
jgi:hypothetical protein